MTMITPDPALTISPQRRLKADSSPAATRLCLPTQWPVVGGRGRALAPRADWPVDPDHSGIRVSIGALGCPGFHGLARTLQMPVHKISVSFDETRGLATRIEAIDRDRYGSLWRENDDWHDDDGFDSWELCQLPEIAELSPRSPVRQTPRALIVDLPANLIP